MNSGTHFVERVNQLASTAVPFFFLIDFEKEKPRLFTIPEAKIAGIKYDLRGRRNFDQEFSSHPIADLQPRIIPSPVFSKAFNTVRNHIRRGNSYLVNLTFATPLMQEIDLEEVFLQARAPYRLYYPGKFVVYSPECFIRIRGNHVYSYPMKGTIDASIPDAREQLLKNKKEIYEHNTIVDLIRNDLAMISRDVRVNQFRYLEKIKSYNRELYQASSEIQGTLPDDWRANLGDLLWKLLPAGSISGAPKQKTMEIIREAERSRRGYYTGIFGLFDGKNLDSAVSIRFIERKKEGMVYRSGGGITAHSNEADEYHEITNKIYVPVA